MKLNLRKIENNNNNNSNIWRKNGFSSHIYIYIYTHTHTHTHTRTPSKTEINFCYSYSLLNTAIFLTLTSQWESKHHHSGIDETQQSLSAKQLQKEKRDTPRYILYYTTNYIRLHIICTKIMFIITRIPNKEKGENSFLLL